MQLAAEITGKLSGNSSGDSGYDGGDLVLPSRQDTVAVVVSGTDGGSGEKQHPGGSSLAFVANSIALLTSSLPFKVEVVAQDSPIFFDHLWLPGLAAQVQQHRLARL